MTGAPCFFAVLALSVLAAAAEPVSALPSHGDAIVALLSGRPVITEADLLDYQATQACYGEGALTSRKAAFMRLLEASIAGEAMRAGGGPTPDEAVLKEESDRIDKETRAPEIVACIKKHYGDDARRYRKIFVRLAWIASRFRVFSAYDPGVQERARRQYRLAAERVHAGTSMDVAARELGLAYSSATYSLESSSQATQTVPAELARYGMPVRPHEAQFIQEHLAGLTIGQLNGEPIETDYDLQLVRLLGRDGVRSTFESISVRKGSAASWLGSLPKMSLSIKDEPLQLWVEGLQGNPSLAAVTIEK